eukprot:9747163-Ditylum_brightwellii.AAC.1
MEHAMTQTVYGIFTYTAIIHHLKSLRVTQATSSSAKTKPKQTYQHTFMPASSVHQLRLYNMQSAK